MPAAMTGLALWCADPYDSESEDTPRNVLHVDGDFTLKDNPDYVFKLRNFDPQVVHANRHANSSSPNEAPSGPNIIAIRPFVPAYSKARVKQAMGNFEAGVWTGTDFVPPSPTMPTGEVFAQRPINSTSGMFLDRFCIRRRYAPSVSPLKTMAIYTDGACLDNGSTSETARAGFAFSFNAEKSGTGSAALEYKGPDGQLHTHTSNRAELRAIIAALAFRVWWGEGWERIVIITDSQYVTNHVTGWLRTWATRDWTSSAGKPVANRDLWEKLSEGMGMLAEGGCEVSFWAVPRAENARADKAAKNAARTLRSQEKYSDIKGVLV